MPLWVDGLRGLPSIDARCVRAQCEEAKGTAAVDFAVAVIATSTTVSSSSSSSTTTTTRPSPPDVATVATVTTVTTTTTTTAATQGLWTSTVETQRSGVLLSSPQLLQVTWK